MADIKVGEILGAHPKNLKIKFKLLFLLRPCALMTPASVQHQVCGGPTGSTSSSASSSQETAEIAKIRASFPTNTNNSFTFERVSVASEVAPTKNQSKPKTQAWRHACKSGSMSAHSVPLVPNELSFYPSF